MANKNFSIPGGQISLFGTPDVPDTFRKAVQVVHSKPKQPLSLVQRKIGNAWQKNALLTEPDSSGWFTIGIRDLATDIGFDSNNRQHLKDAAEALMSIVYEWDVIAPMAKRSLWKASVMFPEVELHEDMVRYQFSSQLRETLLKPEVYALIDMNVVRKFRRASSLALWEQCVRYENIGRTGEIPWQLLRDMILGQEASNKTYEEYKYFKGKVLKPSLVEINDVSDHLVTLHEKKLGRRISTVAFSIKRKHVAQDPLAADTIELVSEMTKLGVPASEANRLIKTYEAENIKQALAFTKARMHDKKLSALNSPAAYFRNAVKQGLAKDLAPKEQQPKQQVDIRAAFLSRRTEEAGRYFQELEADEQTALMERYNEQQVAPSLKFGKNKPKNSVVAAFYGWLSMDTWGEPSAEELLTFAETLLQRKE